MASYRSIVRDKRVAIMKYEVLVEFDSDADGRHYVPGEVVSLKNWKPETIDSAIKYKLVKQKEEIVEVLSEVDDGVKEVEHGSNSST